MPTVSRPLALLLGLAACGKPAPSGPPAAAAPEVPQVAAPASPPPAPPAPPTPAAVCEALLDQAFAVARENLATVSPLTPAFEATLRANSDFVRVCLKLSDPERACLSASANPLRAVHTCPNASGEPLVLPDVSPLLTPAPPAALPPTDGAAVLLRLAGSWRRIEPRSGVVTTWSLGPDGAVLSASQTQGDRPVEGAALPTRVSVPRSGRLELSWRGAGSQSFVFFEAGPDVFYASADMRAAPVEVPDPDKPFTLPVDDRFLRQDAPGRCRLLTATGDAAPASCALSAPLASGERTFTATLPAAPSAPEETLVWRIHRPPNGSGAQRLFVPPELAHEGRFERQAPVSTP
jgi:hypothetical protein